MNVRLTAALLSVLLLNSVVTPALAQVHASAAPPLTRSPLVTKLQSSQAQLSPFGKCQLRAMTAKIAATLKAAGPGANATSIVTAAGYGPGSGLGDDVSAMAYVVLMQAVNDQDNDLELIMAATKEQTAAKQYLRDQLATVNADAAGKAQASAAETQALEKAALKLPPGPCAVPNVDAANATFRAKRLSVAAKLTPSMAALLARIAASLATAPPPASGDAATQTVASQLDSTKLTADQLALLQFVALQEALQAQVDSMSATSQMTAMQLQLAMDRRSKFVEALSNIMKKIDSTQETIIQNLKG